jgi:hypothetical protein
MRPSLSRICGFTIGALALLLAAACSDYDVWEDGGNDPYLGDDDTDDPGDGSGVADDDTGLDQDDDDDTGMGQDDDDGDDDDTGFGEDDDDDDATDEGDDDDDDDGGDEDCPGGVSATVIDSDGDGWVVITTSDTEDWAIVNVPVDGVYEIYDSQLAESGSSQMNETGYLTVTNSVNPNGYPVTANCGLYHLVADADNNGTPTSAIYVGTFSLMAGEDNLLTLHHYCPMYQDGHCTSFHNGDPNTGSGCNTTNANSLHMDLDGICIVPW